MVSVVSEWSPDEKGVGRGEHNSELVKVERICNSPHLFIPRRIAIDCCFIRIREVNQFTFDFVFGLSLPPVCNQLLCLFPFD